MTGEPWSVVVLGPETKILFGLYQCTGRKLQVDYRASRDRGGAYQRYFGQVS